MDHPLRHATRTERRAAAARLPAGLRAAVFRPIGVVRSPFRWREQAPRQAGLAANEGEIRLLPGYRNGLKDIGGFTRLWVLAWFHRSHGWKPQIVPPRDRVKRGLFATRAPDRPNALGLSCVRLLAVYGGSLLIADHDLLDGTPVLDLKPYIPAYDSHPLAAAGWVDALHEPGPDHRLPADGRRPGRR
jgi:tRNA-Thr(GGU) m(6)t(6)A37 methyltransferase TsaA